MSVEFQNTIPILCIFDVGESKEFYVALLGFMVNWENRFEEKTQRTRYPGPG